MVRRKKVKLTIPQYREREEIFKALGYREIRYNEKGIHAYVTMEIEDNSPYYSELREYERTLFAKGPSFVPILLLVVIAFTLLSTFVILFAQQKGNFDLVTNALAFLLPAFFCLFLDVIYTYFYFTINKKLIDKGGYLTKEQILQQIEEIKK